MAKVGVTDIEANNLWYGISRFHCAWVIDPNDRESRIGYRPDEAHAYLEHLKSLDVVVFHNGVDFDGPALYKLYPEFKGIKMFDTIVLSRMLFPERKSHSLKSWGIELGVLKGDYGSAQTDEEGVDVWEKFSEEMFEYCEQDVEVTVALYLYLCEIAGFDPEDPPAKYLDFTEIDRTLKTLGKK